MDSKYTVTSSTALSSGSKVHRAMRTRFHLKFAYIIICRFLEEKNYQFVSPDFHIKWNFLFYSSLFTTVGNKMKVLTKMSNKHMPITQRMHTSTTHSLCLRCLVIPFFNYFGIVSKGNYRSKSLKIFLIHLAYRILIQRWLILMIFKGPN